MEMDKFVNERTPFCSEVPWATTIMMQSSRIVLLTGATRGRTQRVNADLSCACNKAKPNPEWPMGCTLSSAPRITLGWEYREIPGPTSLKPPNPVLLPAPEIPAAENREPAASSCGM